MSHPLLGSLAPNEIALLEILACFAPDPIPRVLFDTDRAEEIWREVMGEESPAKSLRETLDALVRLDLVIAISEFNAVATRESIQEEVRERQALQSRRLGFALRFLNEAVRSDMNVEWELFHSHIIAATNKADRCAIAEPTSDLMSALADWLAGVAQFDEAESLQRRALEIESRSFGPYSTRAARCLSRLALTLHATARPFEAQLLMRRALAIEQCYGPENPGIADRRADLASISQHQDAQATKSTESAAYHSDRVSDEYESELTEDVQFVPTSGSFDSRPSIFSDEQLTTSSPVEGIPRSGRILFVTRCLQRMEWSADCVPEMAETIRTLVSQALAALELLMHSPSGAHFPLRSALHDCIQGSIRHKRSASRQMQFDSTVEIENLIRFLTAIDYAMGTARAINPQTSIRFTELTAATTAVTQRHRNAQRTDLLALHRAGEGRDRAEVETIDAEILGSLWE